MNNYPEMTNAELEQELDELIVFGNQSNGQTSPTLTAEELHTMIRDLQTDQCNNFLVFSALKAMEGLVHELQVHQVELEMQNRELREARQSLESEHQRYVDLYDFAPNGYVTLDEQGLIREINLPGAQMLGKERSYLIGKPFVVYLAQGESRQFLEHLQRCQQGEETVTTELTLKGDRMRTVQLLSVSTREEAQPEHVYRTALLDVTARKLAEEAKRASELLSQSVLGALSAQIAVLDKAGTIIAVNEAWTNFTLMNGEKDALRHTGIGVNYLDVCRRVTGEDAALATQTARGIQVVLDGLQARFTLEYACHLSTQERWFTLIATPLLPGPSGVVVSHVDITERKRAETTVHESETRLAGILNSAMDAIITTDAEQRIVFFNAAAEKMFGCSAAEAAGEPVDRFIPERFRSGHHRHIKDFGKTSVTKRSMGSLGAIYGMRSNGEEFSIEASISQMESNGHRFFTVILRDITKRQLSEEALRRERDKVQQYLDVVEVMMVVLGKEAEILEVNRKGCEVLGYAERELVGKNWFDVCIPVEERQFVQTVFQRVITGKVEQDEYVENKVLTKTGEERLIRWHNVVLMDATGNLSGTLSSGEDITETKKLEAQFLRAQRLESIGTLASGIAHDLNNVLSPITMGVQLLQMKSNDESVLRLLDMIMQNAQRGADLIKQVLSFARGAGAQKTTLQPNHLIKEIIKILRETLPKHITLKQMLATELATVEGDPTQLHQVLMNLCVNARDAMPDQGTLTIEAENIILDEHYVRLFPEARQGPYALITVTDTGTGIPAEILDRIFDPFFTTKDPGKGTGLGLATVQGIVKNHGGFINVYSELGKGTQFKIYLPAITSTQTSQAAAAISNLPAGHGETILVVDDETHIREITRTMLETFGYRVLSANEGAEGLRLYAEHHNEIAAVLTDMMMPLMDGPTMVRALQKINPHVVIIASSGLAEGERASGASALGIKTFLSKPYTAETLLHTLDKVVNTGTRKE